MYISAPVEMAQAGDVYAVEIVGLNGSDNGRTCTKHEACGTYVNEGQVLRMKEAIVTINGSLQRSIKFVAIDDMTESCTVGFAGKATHQRLRELGKVNKFVVVEKLYDKSENTFERRKSHTNKGMARCRILHQTFSVQSRE